MVNIGFLLSIEKLFLVYHVCMLIGPLQCIYKAVTVSQNGFSHIDSSGKLGPAFRSLFAAKRPRNQTCMSNIPKDLQITDDLGAGCYQLKSFWFRGHVKFATLCIHTRDSYKVLYVL